LSTCLATSIKIPSMKIKESVRLNLWPGCALLASISPWGVKKLDSLSG